MDNTTKSQRLATVPMSVGDAEGMEKRNWYVAIVQHNTEKRSAEKLCKMKIEHYVATQREHHIWKDGRKAKVDKVIIPSTLFIKCTDAERREIVKLPFINRFMTNKAGIQPNSDHKPLAVIPDDQIETLKFMLGQTETPITITPKPVKKGDRVKVIRGELRGLEGEVLIITPQKSELIVSLDFIGCARLAIETQNIEKIN